MADKEGSKEGKDGKEGGKEASKDGKKEESKKEEGKKEESKKEEGKKEEGGGGGKGGPPADPKQLTKTVKTKKNQFALNRLVLMLMDVRPDNLSAETIEDLKKIYGLLHSIHAQY